MCVCVCERERDRENRESVYVCVRESVREGGRKKGARVLCTRARVCS